MIMTLISFSLIFTLFIGLPKMYHSLSLISHLALLSLRKKWIKKAPRSDILDPSRPQHFPSIIIHCSIRSAQPLLHSLSYFVAISYSSSLSRGNGTCNERSRPDVDSFLADFFFLFSFGVNVVIVLHNLAADQLRYGVKKSITAEWLKWSISLGLSFSLPLASSLTH